MCQSVLTSDSRGALECNQTHCSAWEGWCISISRNGQRARTEQEPHCLHGGAGEPIYQYVMTYRRVLSGLRQTPCQMLISLFSASLLLSLTGCSSHSVGREFLAKGKESWLKVSVCSRDCVNPLLFSLTPVSVSSAINLPPQPWNVPPIVSQRKPAHKWILATSSLHPGATGAAEERGQEGRSADVCKSNSNYDNTKSSIYSPTWHSKLS